MKLDLSQIEAITQGASYVKESKTGISFHRFSKEEEEFYAATSFAQKAQSTAGIQLVFKTDADSLFIKATVSEGSTRKYFSFDIYVNDVLSAEFKNYEKENLPSPYTVYENELGSYDWSVDFEKGEKTVRIVFPFGARAEVSKLILENASFVTPVKRSKTMLMYGDSITHGYDALNPSRAYAVQLSHMLDAEAFNKAIGGEVFRPGLSEIKSDVNPDYITVAYGTNDWSNLTKEVFEDNCLSFYKNLHNNYPDAEIFAITPIWRDDYCGERVFGPFSDVSEIIKKVCNSVGNITVIDGFDLVPHDTNLFADFRLHPTNEGFDFYTENLYKQIIKYIHG